MICRLHGPWAMGQMGMGSNVIGTTAAGAISYSNSIWWRSLAEQIGSLKSGELEDSHSACQACQHGSMKSAPEASRRTNVIVL